MAQVSLAVARVGGATRLVHLAESGSARLRVPRSQGPAIEVVTINTGGGVAAGDRFATEIAVGGGAHLVATSAAAEKIYRSDGDVADIRTAIRVGCAGQIDWLPQETILFDRARLRRSLDVDVAAGGSALLFEAVVFGRAAHGEEVRSGYLQDRWRVRREGLLVYADTLCLSGEIAERLAHQAVAGGMKALATCLLVAPDAEARLDEARAALEGAGSACAASAWNGLLSARFLAQDVNTLRRDAARFLTALRRRPLPRVWHL